MPRKPIDLEAVRRTTARLDQLLRERPHLREPNPDRQQALADWLETLDKETDHGQAKDW